MTDFETNQPHVREVRNVVMRSVLFFLFALIVMTGWAQTQQQDSTKVKKEKKIYLYGYLSDSFTRSHIPDSKVVLLRPDSTLVDSAQVDNNGWGGIKSSEWYMQAC